LLLVVAILVFPVKGEESINSDIRIEIISQIKHYEEEIKYLVKKAEKSQNLKEKRLIMEHIEILKGKIKKLKKSLERYEDFSDIIG